MTGILFLLEDYWSFYSQRLAESAELRGATYEEKLSALLDASFYIADSYERAFAALGHESTSIVPHCAGLQEAWAREHGVFREGDFGDGGWRRILLHQIRALRPDVLYFFSGVWPDATLLRECRRYAGTLALQWSCRLWPTFPYKSFDLILSSMPRLVEEFRGLGVSSELLPHSFDPRVLKRIEQPRRVSGAVFAGTLWELATYRSAVVERLAGSLDDFTVYAPDLKVIAPESPIRRVYRGEAFGLDMFGAYARSAVAIHVAGDEVLDFAGARRPFEVAGSGAVLMAGAQPGLDELFKADEEVVIFESADDCLDKTRFLLDHPAEASAIASAGQARVLRDHSIDRRAEQIDELLRSRRAPRRWPSLFARR